MRATGLACGCFPAMQQRASLQYVPGQASRLREVIMSGVTGGSLAWLQDGPNGIKDPTDASAILATYASTPTIGTIRGPDILMRAVGRNEIGQLGNAYRGYWVRQSTLMGISRNLGQFEGWLTSQELSAQAETRYRALAAICLNWNDFNEFAEMQVPLGQSIPCLIGPVAAQPVHSSMNPTDPKTPILRGGAEQIFIRSGDSNPLWVYIRAKSSIF
jgi:hypothetical protein